MRKIWKRLAALCLAAAVALGACPAGAAPAAEGDTVTVATRQDLLDLAAKCRLDSWSVGKTVRLTADVDLSGTEFSPIPTFGGTFEGNGHTIAMGRTDQGLFRTVQAGAVVRDLTVTGGISAEESGGPVGGIAASNAGTLLNCAFQGSAAGKRRTGGIAGENLAGGTLHGCTAEGYISGRESTGGIAGYNSGTVTGCVNRAAVNTREREESWSIGDGLKALNKEEVLSTTADTGGVAGFSSGTLRSCRNDGAVGCPHVGYNVGGIAGRSCGYMEGCVNTGAVAGRKDVGGAAGQIAPDIRQVFSASTVDQLRDELQRLNDLVNDAVDHTDGSRGTISARLDDISDTARAAADSADEMADRMQDWTDSSLDQVNDLGDTLADTMDRLETITENSEDILDAMADGMDQVEDALDRMSTASGYGEDGLEDLSGCVEKVRLAVRGGKDGLAQVKSGLSSLSDALVVNDPAAMEAAMAQIRAGTDALSAGLDQCAAGLEETARLLTEEDWTDPEVQAALAQCLGSLADGLHSAADGAALAGSGAVAAAGNVRIDWSKVKESAEETAKGLKTIADALDGLDGALADGRDALDHFADVAGELEPALEDLSDGLDTFEKAARDMADTAGEVHDLFSDLADRDPIHFDKLGDDFQQAQDDFTDALDTLADQMDALRDEVNAAGDTLSADIRALGDQMQVISDLLLDALSDGEDLSKDDLWDDVSQQQIDRVTQGKARGCMNQGAVSGDLNVGGVAGAMAVELDFDREDDITQEGDRSLDFTFETRAVLQDCVNQGRVTAKKDAAGGVVGRMELGYVLDCRNYGGVTSTDGDYAGGIAGYAGSTLRGCWAKCTVTGTDYVGGIAGYGYELYRCVGLVSLPGDGEYRGAVAGDWDREDGVLSGNRFVDGPLAGADGVSYAGRAEPVAYADLLADPDLPGEFRSLTVTYEAEGVLIALVSCAYGQGADTLTAPQVPEKEGYWAAWEDLGEETLTVDHVLEAVYTPYATTLASAPRDGTHPVFLAEGTFSGDGTLTARRTEEDPGRETWTVTLTGQGSAGTHTLRFYPPADWAGARLSLVTEGKAAVLSGQWEGRYYVVSVVGDSFTLLAEETAAGGNRLWLLAAIPGAAAVCLALVLVRRHKRKG